MIKGNILTLKLVETFFGDDKIIPFYYFDIYLNENDNPIGKISIRIGHNEHSYYNGNLGYEIDEDFRGKGYAKEAVLMIYDIARYHGMSYLYVSCNNDNLPSKKVINKLGGLHLEDVFPPKSYVFYYDNMPMQSIYLLAL